MGWKTLFFSTKGRINRLPFWIGWAVLFGISIAGSFISAQVPHSYAAPVYGLVLGALLFPKIALFSKRLHDIGWPGWPAAVVLAAYDIQAFFGNILVRAATEQAFASGRTSVREISERVRAATEAFTASPPVAITNILSFVLLIVAGLAWSQIRDNKYGLSHRKAGKSPAADIFQ